jgi:chorismate dehydratase
MMFRGRVAAVSYLNTVPFIYGMEHADDLRAALLLSPPSGCARAFSAGLADIALVPTGALPTLDDAHIITPFCIGASGRVRTVTLMSDEPLERIERVYLDPHSMTSALLVQVLCKHHFNIAPRFVSLDDYARVDAPAAGDGFMLIGDKVFDYEGRLAHTWDLAEEWERMTGLPFVFAVWVAREGVPREAVEALEAALAYGTAHIREAIAHCGHSGKPYALDYLTRNIDYRFDEAKHRALTLFKQMMP